MKKLIFLNYYNIYFKVLEYITMHKLFFYPPNDAFKEPACKSMNNAVFKT